MQRRGDQRALRHPPRRRLRGRRYRACRRTHRPTRAPACSTTSRKRATSGPWPVPTRSRLMAMIRSGQCAGSAKSVDGPRSALGAEIERQHEALAEGGAKLLPILGEAQAFSADDQCRPERQPEGAIGDVGEAGIDPQRAARKGAREIAAELEMIADPLDGIEVGDIEHGRAGDGEKGAGDARPDRRRRLEASRSAGIRRAPRRGVHHGPAFQVEGRNDGEVVHGAYSYYLVIARHSGLASPARAQA